MSRHRTRDVVKIRRPSASGLELVGGFVEWGITGSAGVDAGFGHVLVVFASEGGFSAFLTDDTELFLAMLAFCIDRRIGRGRTS